MSIIMKKRVLITGGNGFIGRHTLIPLIKLGYEVHVVTSQPGTGTHTTNHAVDLLDCSKHLPLIETIRPSHLLLAAWYTEHGKFWDATENVDWLKATISLGKIFYSKGGQRILGVGTCAEYDWEDGLCIEGKTKEAPISLYGKIKLTTYECLQTLAQMSGQSFVWARIFFTFGPGECKNRLIPYLILKLLKVEKAESTQENKIRDFLHVSDLGNALAILLNTNIQGIINIGSGIPITIQEMVTKIATQLQREDLISFSDASGHAYSPNKILADISKLKNETDWQPTLPIDEGLSKTIQWWKNLIEVERNSTYENRN